MIYYLFHYGSSLPGVVTKVISKVTLLRSLGVNIKCLLMYNDINCDFTHLPDGIYEKYFVEPNFKPLRIFQGRYLGVINHFLKSRDLNKKINDILKKKNYKLIISRYGTSNLNSLFFIKRIDGKILYESNTIELDQIKSVFHYKGVLSSPFWVTYEYLSEKVFGPWCMKKSSGVICVSNEIAEYQKNRIGKRMSKRVYTVSNGINTEGYPICSQDSKFERLNLLMTLGVDSSWNGLDVIVNAIENSCNNKIKLFVVGNVKKISKDKRIEFLGKMTKEGLDSFMQENIINIGVGTLGLTRKGMEEASPLKVREYLARGLPILYNYYDTDLDSDMEFSSKFCIKFCGKIDFDIILSRYKEISKIKDFNLKIKNWAFQNIDHLIKMAEYKRIIEEILTDLNKY